MANLFSSAPLAMGMGFFTACAYLALLSQERVVGVWQAAVWVAAQALTTANGEFLAFRGAKAKGEPALRRRWVRAYLAASVIAGLVWTVGAMSLFPPATPPQAWLLVVFLLAQACGAALGASGLESAAFAYILPVTLPMGVWFVAQGDERNLEYGLVTFLFVAALSALVHQSNRSARRALELECGREALIEQLRLRTQLAEEASQSKSRFLASASHDLRQPVHALGMFVGALREQRLAPESARLVEHISNSIEGLDSLFASLLDISKLDARALKVNAKSFALGPMLQRMGAEFKLEAADKGIRLKVVPCRRFVRADPVLLETTLRNIVGNALRYTDKGRVLVGSRRRGGRLAIEILDTGRGIGETELEKVFEEFYQVGNPERDRARGLGLGLAIVKRIAALMDCDLEIESELGRGTRVSLFVPLAERPAPERASPPPDAAPEAEGGVIFVIDDEAAIREGMRSLLNAWGYRTLVADSGPQMFGLLAESPLRPDLVVCDLRLRDGEDGVELLQRLRKEFNEEIPGIVVTGDAAPNRAGEAQAESLIVLHKPLTSARLRTAVRTLVARARAPGASEAAAAETAGSE